MLFSLFSQIRAGAQIDIKIVIAQIVAILIIVFLVLPFHEWAHGITAYLLGDKSIKYSGRLTMNPLAHIDPFGALCLLLFGFGWAKPVPIDTRGFRYPRTYMAITAVMGPIANVLAAIVGGFIYYGILAFAGVPFMTSTAGSYVMEFFIYYIQINCFLAAFNIIPIPPLDGSKVLFSFFPQKWLIYIQKFSPYFFILIYALLFLGILSVPINFISNALINFVSNITSLPFKGILG